MVYLRFVHLLAGKDQESLKSLRKIRRKEANGKILPVKLHIFPAKWEKDHHYIILPKEFLISAYENLYSMKT